MNSKRSTFHSYFGIHHSAFYHRHVTATERAVRKMSGGGGTHTGFGRTGRRFPRADTLQPVGDMQLLAVGPIIEVRAARAVAEDQFAGLQLAAALGMNLIAATVDIKCR